MVVFVTHAVPCAPNQVLKESTDTQIAFLIVFFAAHGVPRVPKKVHKVQEEGNKQKGKWGSFSPCTSAGSYAQKKSPPLQRGKLP
jgi:hypothetical protein